VIFSSTTALAQNRNPFSSTEARFEVSGGYSYTWGDVRLAKESSGLPKGWNVGFVWFAAENVGFNVDVGAHYGPQYFGTLLGTVDASLYTYLAGVKMAYPVGRFEIDARLLGGVAHFTGTPGDEFQSDTGVAIGFGSGLDIPIGRFGIRAAQFDIVISSALRTVSPVLSAGAYYRW
jgi:hypothetical protein